MPTAPTKITTISFDADGTLWDFEKVMREALGQALAELQRRVALAPDALSVETMIAIRDEVWEEFKGKETNLEKIRLTAFRRTLEYVGLTDEGLAAHLNSLYLKHRYEHIQLFDDVLPTLDALQGRYVLGILSNGNTHPDRCGLPGRFQFVVQSQDHGLEKPAPGIFMIALQQAGCAAGEMLHVGDSLSNDVAGAQGVGVPAVWLNRDQHPSDPEIRPDFEITALTELLKVCEQLA
ncbi:MAG: HAD family hydrolase [Dehalococcoidia bacterium]